MVFNIYCSIVHLYWLHKYLIFYRIYCVNNKLARYDYYWSSQVVTSAVFQPHALDRFLFIFTNLANYNIYYTIVVVIGEEHLLVAG